MPSSKVKLQCKILSRAWEGGAFDDLAERHRAVGVHNVSTATQTELDEFLAASKEVGERIVSLLGEPLRRGVCEHLARWGYGSFPGGLDLVYALGLRHHETVHARAFPSSPAKGSIPRPRRGRRRR